MDSTDPMSLVGKNAKNIETVLKELLKEKEIEILDLKNEKMKEQIAAEDCRAELRLQSKELSTLRKLLADRNGTTPQIEAILHSNRL